MVMSRGAGDTYQGNHEGNIAGRQEDLTGKEDHTVGAGGDIRGRRAGLLRCWDENGRRPGGRMTTFGGWK